MAISLNTTNNFQDPKMSTLSVTKNEKWKIKFERRSNMEARSIISSHLFAKTATVCRMKLRAASEWVRAYAVLFFFFAPSISTYRVVIWIDPKEELAIWYNNWSRLQRNTDKCISSCIPTGRFMQRCLGEWIFIQLLNISDDADTDLTQDLSMQIIKQRLSFLR